MKADLSRVEYLHHGYRLAVATLKRIADLIWLCMATAQEVLDIARSLIGYKESPAGSNKTKFTNHAEPWCVDMINWIFGQLDIEQPVKTASVYMLYNAYKKAGRLYNEPQPGDIAFWSYGQGHAELVESVPMDGRSVVDIGGNTSSGDGSPDNGGEVARKRRSRNSQLLGFGRPAYSNTPTPSPAPAPASVENDDMIQYEWPDGAIVCVDPSGNAYCPSYPGRPTAKHYGGIPALRDDAKQAFSGKVVSVVGVDRSNSQAGYVMLDESWGANGETYKFDPSVSKFLK